MKIYIQEMIRGHIEVVKEEYLNDVIQELVKREIPFKVDYVYNDEPIFDTLTQHKKSVVSSDNLRVKRVL